MNVRRIAASCMILTAMGGCSQLITVPAQYAVLPPGISSSSLREADQRPTDIPGTLLGAPSQARGPRVEPFIALQQSASARAGWEDLRPSDFMRQSRTATRTGQVTTAEPASTASLPGTDKRRATGKAGSQGYDGDTTMTRLVKSGRDAAKPICTSC
jgi:hypothetical protein